jgi:hypothetical protein
MRSRRRRASLIPEQPTESAARAAFAQQATWCRKLGSPFTGLLCELLALHLDRSTATGRRVLDWHGRADALADAVPLRLAGALHALVREGRLPDLAALYPPRPLPAPERLWAAVAAALAQADRALLPWLDHPPQTNETGRSALFMAGLLVLAHRQGLPFALYEIGASAGLNLALDRYAYDLGGLATGAIDSPLLLAPAWRGPPPPDATVRIASRLGADLQPLDVADPADRARLAAYVWPDQQDRLQRLQTALALAAADPPRVERAEAADWVESRITPAPEPGRCRVLCHSIALHYFTEATKARIARYAERVGAMATPQAPFAWLQFETGEASQPTLSLRSWPGDRSERLATANAHATRIDWLHRP